MGIYLNPDETNYQETRNWEYFVDKSMFIEFMNKLIRTPAKFLCISRPRRFGKSTDANMLVAYYSKGTQGNKIFDGLKISESETYLTHLNKKNVIHINVQDFESRTKTTSELVQLLSQKVIAELMVTYSYLEFDKNDLSFALSDIYQETKDGFIFIFDEWDCIFRNRTKVDFREYLDFLRILLKDKPYVEFAYMTGILPIKKYGSHSALNMFKEVSMVDPSIYSGFMGFTEQEVKTLCQKFEMNFDEMQEWYDGYHLYDDISIYSPRSVIFAITDKRYKNYWTTTETYEALAKYISMNFDGLKEDIIKLLLGETISVNPDKFQNDMTTFKSKDDVLTLLVHLGYLGIHDGEVYIPNKEVTSSFVASIEDSSWDTISNALNNSEETLKYLWSLNA